MSRLGVACAGGLLALAVCAARGQGAAAAVEAPQLHARPSVAFSFERIGLAVPRYRLTIHDDGAGSYEGEELPPNGRGEPAAGTAARPFKSEVMVSPETVKRVFKLARGLKDFNMACASKAKNIADTGTKTLSYAAADGTGSCTYNYTENKDVQALTEIFQGIAETMDEGRTLDHLHRYDRLGLDDAITFLAKEIADGHALEVGTIAASLRSIAQDADVMQRVRTKASALLAMVPADLQAGP